MIKKYICKIPLYVFFLGISFWGYLLCTGQIIFPEEKVYSLIGEDVIEAESLKTKKYQLYLFVTEEKLYMTSFSARKFWIYDGLIKIEKNNPITVNIYGSSIWREKVIYGCCNEEVTQVNICLRTGEILPVILGKERTFILVAPHEGAAEIFGYNQEGNLVYQQFLEGY